MSTGLNLVQRSRLDGLSQQRGFAVHGDGMMFRLPRVQRSEDDVDRREAEHRVAADRLDFGDTKQGDGERITNLVFHILRRNVVTSRPSATSLLSSIENSPHNVSA